MDFSQSDFNLWKKQALNKLDKSSIGEIDEKVRELCYVINDRDDMFTLSSCSGRICLMKDSSKVENIWHFASHDEISFDDIDKSLEDYSGEPLLFIQESVILHVCVSSMELARSFMHLAKECSLNQVGIISCRSKIVVEVICDSRLELPIYDKEILVCDDYLERLIKRANLNLRKSWEAIDKLEREVKKL